MTCKQCGKSLPKGTKYTIIYTKTKVQPRYCIYCLLSEVANCISSTEKGDINYLVWEEIEKKLKECLVEYLI